MKHRERTMLALTGLIAGVSLIIGPIAGIASAQTTPSLTDGTNTMTSTDTTASDTSSTSSDTTNSETTSSTTDNSATNNSSSTPTVDNASNTMSASSSDSSTVGEGGTASSTTAAGAASTFLATAATTTATSSAPVISNIIATPGQTSAVIMWTTDVPANSLVNYGTNAFYGASSTLQASSTTNHVATLFGLAPNTAYHFQVVSQNASSTMATSSDQTFTTLAASPPAPSISGITVTPSDTSAQIVWTTDQAANGQVRYGTTTASYFASTTLDTGLGTSHSQTLTGLTPNLTYHFQVLSANGSSTMATSSDQSFTTLSSAGTGTSTATSTAEELRMLRDRITALEQLIRTLSDRIAALIGMIGNGGGTGGGTGTTTPPTAGVAHIDQNGQRATVGSTIDFGGHGFLTEEDVRVTLNGSQIAAAHADSEGNFSTGSVSVPGAPGTYTYVFTGARGDSASATVTVQS